MSYQLHYKFSTIRYPIRCPVLAKSHCPRYAHPLQCCLLPAQHVFVQIQQTTSPKRTTWYIALNKRGVYTQKGGKVGKLKEEEYNHALRTLIPAMPFPVILSVQSTPCTPTHQHILPATHTFHVAFLVGSLF